MRKRTGMTLSAIGLAMSLLAAACGSDTSTSVAESAATSPTSTTTEATTTEAPIETMDEAETESTDQQDQQAGILDQEFLAETANEMSVSDGAFLFAVVDQNGDAIEGANGVDSNGVQPTASDAFRIGSITKVFTSLATLSLVEDGDVDLDQPASTYVSRVAVPGDVTVRDLLQHTSGIYNITDAPGFFAGLFEAPNRVWLPEEQLELIADRPSLFDPGAQFRYSNTNFVILGVLLEEVTGQPYHEVIRERIIDPLELSSTYVAGFEDGPALFDPYDHEGDVDYDYTSIASVAWSAGGMVSSAQDLHTLFTALFDEQVISGDMIELMTDDAEYGFGVELAEWDQGLIGHSGGIPGYFTMVRHSPATGLTAFLAMTDERTDPGRAIRAMFNAFAGGQ
jgi:D-alanyl-D-alanine carboxypeptidase